MKEKRKNMKPEDFVIVWQTSESVDEVAARLGLRKTSCQQKATQMRRKGVPLKKMYKSRRFSSEKWAALASLARHIEKRGAA